jgi:formylglycine-generating enzyme required for sulfatase activity
MHRRVQLLAVLLCVSQGALLRTQEPSPRVLVRGGSFLMGTPADTIPALRERYKVAFPGVFENEAPAHRVAVADFQIDRDEVTQRRFLAFVDANPPWRKDRLAPTLHNGRYLENWADGLYPDGQAEHPVVFVTWHAAQSYCRWAGGRLPTEAEWEFAARARGDLEFPWGDGPPAPTSSNYAASGVKATVSVGSYPPNPLGINDMAGNVWELLLDEWRERHADAGGDDPIAGGAVPDDRLLTVTGRRALRGGSYGGAPVNLRTRWRDSHVVTNATAFVGFRCAYAASPGERG